MIRYFTNLHAGRYIKNYKIHIHILVYDKPVIIVIYLFRQGIEVILNNYVTNCSIQNKQSQYILFILIWHEIRRFAQIRSLTLQVSISVTYESKTTAFFHDGKMQTDTRAAVTRVSQLTPLLTIVLVTCSRSRDKQVSTA